MGNPTTADNAADYLRERIINGELEPGAPINQIETAAALGVSRSPVRDAIQLLASERLVVARAHATAIVAPLDLDDLQELYELRIAIEPSLCHLALPNLSRVTVLDMAEQLEAMEQTDDGTTWSAINDQFHANMYQKAARPRMVEIVDRARHQTRRYTRLLVSELGTAVSNEQHRQIFRAVDGGNSSELEALVLEHLRSSCDEILKLLHQTRRHEVVIEETEE